MTPSLHALQLSGGSSSALDAWVGAAAAFVSCYTTATHCNGIFHRIYTPAGVNCFSGFEMHVKLLNEPIILWHSHTKNEMAPSWEYLSKSHLLMAQFHFLVCLAILVSNKASLTCCIWAVHHVWRRSFSICTPFLIYIEVLEYPGQIRHRRVS